MKFLNSASVTLALCSFTASPAAVVAKHHHHLRGPDDQRHLTEDCGKFGVCNERAVCTSDGCTMCKDGFKAPPYCIDINECVELDPPPCQFDGAVCVDMDPNLDGSPGGKYKCACRTRDGWADGEVGEFGVLSCTFEGEQGVTDPCAASPCLSSATCASDETGSFTCTCNDNLIGDGITECIPPTVGGPCGADNCASNPFSVCDAVIAKCVCVEGYFQGEGAGGTCEPRNFCTEGNDDCDKDATCFPLLGDAANGFFFCRCNTGYISVAGVKEGRDCVPHDECADGSHDCTASEECVNLDPPLTFECIVPITLAPIAPTPAPVQQVVPAPPLPCTTVNCPATSSCIAQVNGCVCNPGLSGDPNSICLNDDFIIPDTIFGAGNSNGGFTIGRSGGVELGIRAKVRYDYGNLPTERSIPLIYDGDRTYTFYRGVPPNGPVARARWNFDWSINTDYDPVNPSGKKLDDLHFMMFLDGDVTSSIVAVPFDPMDDAGGTPDHSIGDNTTPNGDGTEAADDTEFISLIANNNVAQNSWNLAFFTLFLPPLSGFNPDESGIYTIKIEAMDLTGVVASVSIDVVVLSDDVTPDVIFGTGNQNGGFTTTRSNGVELGIRGKWRYGSAPAGQDPYGFNGDGTYHFPSGEGAADRSIWNFDWSINVDWDATTGDVISDYTYILTTKLDGVICREFDPIFEEKFGVGGTPDHQFGTNLTPSNSGVKTADPVVYATYTSTNNVVQQSWNWGFGDARGSKPFTSDPGVYEISLQAFKDGVEVAAVSITIYTV